MKKLAVIICALLALNVAQANAHSPSTAFLNLVTELGAVRGSIAVSVRDIEYSVGLDANGDGAVSWGELLVRETAMKEFLLRENSIKKGDEQCPITLGEMLVDARNDGAYIVFPIEATCPTEISNEQPLTLTYSLFFSVNTQSRGIVHIRDGENERVVVASPTNHQLTIAGAASSHEAQSSWTFFSEGVWHIWIGFDHILFLLSLLFPSVIIRREGRVVPAESLKAPFLSVLKIVTAFTVAHSITLLLAALDIVALPSRLVEGTIAVSVFLAALNNISTIVVEARMWWVALLFGFIHGFGFATALKETGLTGSLLLAPVLFFNLGVECGQLAIVAVFLPSAFLLRGSRFYRWVVLRGGSALIALIALYWAIERFFLN